MKGQTSISPAAIPITYVI